MVVVGLPAAGAVLVTALVVIPPVAARQWTDRVTTLLVLAGLFGLVSALAGVTASAVLPRSATGPLVVLAAASICAVSIVAAPAHGWLARAIRTAAEQRAWAAGMLLDRCLRLTEESDDTTFARTAAVDSVGGRPAAARAWETLVMQGAVAPVARAGGGDRWRFSAAGLERARERRRRLRAWQAAFDAAPEAAREALTLDLPECPPELGVLSELAAQAGIAAQADIASQADAYDRGPSSRSAGLS
jgi:manganese/zinc/iron transport system permease protein